MTYNLNETQLNLAAGEGYQLSVDSSDGISEFEVEWSVPSVFADVVTVDSDGYVTTYYRDGMTSASATITVTARVRASGKAVKTLNCKVTATQ